MNLDSERAAQEIRDRVSRGDAAALSEIVLAFALDDPEDVAFLVDVDGRARLRSGLAVSVELYLDELGSFSGHSVVIDAAIEMTLKSLVGSGRTISQAGGLLESRHPELKEQIRDAVALSEAMWSTSEIRVTGSRVERTLPCAFGPDMRHAGKRYELCEEIARGSSGVVYRARDRMLSDTDVPASVAIKVFPAGRRSREESLGYTDEAKKGRRVSHAYVAGVIDLGHSEDNEDFIVYEFIDGNRLGAHPARYRSPREAVELVARIAEGLQAVHQAGLAHCDLKPSNILIDGNGTPKIIDLGIATRSHEWNRSVGEDEQALGTLAFMSPQQFRGEALGLSPASDIWALGGILYWMLTDQLPSGGSVREAQRTLELGLDLRTWVRPDGKRIRGDLRRVVSRCLAQHPEERYASAREFSESLRDWLDRRPIPWTKPNVVRVFLMWCRRHPVILLSILLVIAGAYSAYASVQIAKEEDMVASSKVYYQFLSRSVNRLQGRDHLTQQLATITHAEWFYGPLMFRDDSVVVEMKQMRMDILLDRVEQARANGMEHHLETLMLESGLSLWMVGDEMWDEALASIDRCTAIWRTRLDGDDPWFVIFGSLRDCALAGKLLEDPSIGGESVAERERFALALAERLDASLPLLKETLDGAPLRQLVYAALISLYDSDFLDDQEVADRYRAENKSLDDLIYPKAR